MAELKLCPFCGSKAEVIKTRSGRNFRYSPGCNTQWCMGHWWMTGKGFETEEKAIEAWNRRADNESHG